MIKNHKPKPENNHLKFDTDKFRNEIVPENFGYLKFWTNIYWQTRNTQNY